MKRILGLIDAPDVEVRCAALLVLTHLQADEEAVVRGVGAALQAKNAVVRDFAVGYFERVRPRGSGARDGIIYLVPLLDTEDDSQRARTVEILSRYGQAAVSGTKKAVAGAPRRRLNAIIELWGRVRSSMALDLLFEMMAGDDFDASRAACDAVMTSVPDLDAPARADLFARSEGLIDRARGQRAGLVAAAKLFGALGEPRARKRLFALLGAQQPQAVRTHALGALTHCLRGQKLTAAEVDGLLPLLEEADEAGILRPAIHLLEDQVIDRARLSQLNRLAESPQPLVKRFAVQKLGGFESGAVVKTLIGYLTDASFARRDQAAASLKGLPAARGALVKELLACDEERKAWTLVDILLAHDRTWKSDALAALRERLDDAVARRDDRLYTAYFHLLNGLDAEGVPAYISGRAAAARRKKDFAQSAKWLALLKDSAAFDEETRLALAIAELKMHPHGVGTVVRRHDPALELLRGLVRSPVSLADRLRKERLLAPEDLFYVAFSFAEGGSEERAVARELFEHLAAKQGRTKIGKAAKNKLRLLAAP